jgi:hypothetical protein
MFEIIKVRDKFEMQQIPERSSLSIMKMENGAEERAAKCEAMRGFKESVAKAERKKEIKELIYEACCDVFGGSLFIGALVLGLWLSSIL